MTASEQDFQSFINEHVGAVEPLYREYCLAMWDAATTGKEEDSARAAELETKYRSQYSSPENLKRLKEWEASRAISDPQRKRQLDLLIMAHLENQMDQELMEKIVNTQQDVERTFATYRAEVNGKKVSDNEIKEILQKSNDVSERKAAWEGSKGIGKEVASRVLELADLRNRVAKNLGYDDFYAMSLSLQEQTEDQLFGICKRFKELSDEPFRRLRQSMDERLAARFGCKPDELRPWHYVDPFFQEAPTLEEISLDPFYEDRDLQELTTRFYSGIGMSIDDILARSDLFERDGKNQHAFCIDIDKKGDIRVLCNLRATTRWMGTMLHEFGHAVYDKYIHGELPFLLRTPSHTFTTEAVAMLMGRQSQEASWLRDTLSLSQDDVSKVGRVARAQLRSEMLVSTRWMLTMIHFERELYRNPEQDLNTLWWDFVEEFQMLRRPENRNTPDWASKIHVSCYPVYYHNYLLGEFMASQLRQYIDTRVLPRGADTMAGHPEVGNFLLEKVFAPGASLRWDDLLESSTGEGLNPEHFVKEFVAVS